jgi:pimeloyl-ACP methyl ester carboxylesterase
VLALAMINSGLADNMALGMQLSVVCAEDFPRITPEDIAEQSKATIFRGHLMHARMKACEFWPKGTVPANYYEPVQSSVPALVLSGELDPVTPPGWGEIAAKTLPNSKHFVAPGTGHGVLGTACGMRIIQQFIEQASVEGLDASCLKLLKRPPFFLTPAGPDPTRASASFP